MNFSVPKRFPSRFSGYIEPPGKQVTTGCRWQKEGLWGRSGAGLGPSPSRPEMPSLSPPFPCLWFKMKRKKNISDILTHTHPSLHFSPERSPFNSVEECVKEAHTHLLVTTASYKLQMLSSTSCTKRCFFPFAWSNGKNSQSKKTKVDEDLRFFGFYIFP